MAIDRRKELDKASLQLVDEIQLNTINESEDRELEDAVKLTRMKSDEAICQKSSNRSVVFLHEHTLLKRTPTWLTCPNCLCSVETVVERDTTRTTHLTALLLIPICLCLLPYYSKRLRDARHRCPECGIHLGARFASAFEGIVVSLGCTTKPDRVLISTESLRTNYTDPK